MCCTCSLDTNTDLFVSERDDEHDEPGVSGDGDVDDE